MNIKTDYLKNEEMIKRKKKKCKSCGDETYIWANGMCKRCHSLSKYAPKSGRSRPKWGNPISRRRKSENNTDRWLKLHFGFRSQIELFNYLWDTSSLTCPFTGQDLEPYQDDEQMRRICCAHVLPKGTYPKWKFNSDNIMLMLPSEHEKQETFEKFIERQDELKREYYKEYYNKEFE